MNIEEKEDNTTTNTGILGLILRACLGGYVGVTTTQAILDLDPTNEFMYSFLMPIYIGIGLGALILGNAIIKVVD